MTVVLRCECGHVFADHAASHDGLYSCDRCSCADFDDAEDAREGWR